VSGFVVGGDGDVDELEGSVGVTEGDDGDVDVSGLSDSLVVNSGVSDDDDSGFLERSSDVVGEVTGGESTGDSVSTSETSVLQDSSVSIRSSRDDTNIGRVLDSSQDSSSQDDLLPSLSDVQDVDTVGSSFPDVVLHGLVTVLGTDVTLGREEELDVLGGGGEDGGVLGVGHFDYF